MGDSPWRNVVSTAAVVTTVGQFLAGSLVCKKFIDKGSTGEASGFQFACGLLSCSMWLRYGHMRDDDNIIFVNSIGAVLMLCYSVVYHRFAVKKSTFSYQFVGVALTIALVLYYTVHETSRDLAVETMGAIASFITILFIVAPMTMLAQVVRTRSTESLPFPVIFMSLIVSALWYTYGVISQDTYIQLTNATGAILAAAQLSLFLIFPGSAAPPPPAYKKLNDVLL